jgi:hypothetical protein
VAKDYLKTKKIQPRDLTLQEFRDMVEGYLKLQVSSEELTIIVNQFTTSTISMHDLETKFHEYKQLHNVTRALEQERLNKVIKAVLASTDPQGLTEQYINFKGGA